jgi:DNA-binding GntR family transcriptional regulator
METASPRAKPRRRDTSPALLPLQRQTVAQMTLDAVRERIVRGIYREGEPLRQDALAIEIGVSRIPIREALRQLESEGLVTFNPHRGAIVSSLSLAEIDEVFALRAMIESDLLRQAIPNLNPERVARATEILTAYDRALEAHDVAAWGELNWKFHSTLYAAADRPIAMGVAQRLHQHADRYLRMQLALTHGETQAKEEHRSILAASRRKDAKAACAQLRAHIIGAGDRLLTFLTAHRAADATSHRRKSTA